MGERAAFKVTQKGSVMRGWIKRHKARIYLLIVLVMFFSAWGYIYRPELDRHAYKNFKQEFFTYLQSEAWLEKHKDITCDFIYPKDKVSLNIKECVGGIYNLSYPITQRLARVFAVDFAAYSVPDTLAKQTNIIDTLKDFIARKPGSNEEAALILIRREAKEFGSTEGIELFLVK